MYLCMISEFEMIADKKYYMDLFGVTGQSLESLVGEALATGGDYADLYFENTVSSDLLLRDGQVGNGGFSIDYGVGIRVLNGDKTGYAYAESTEPRAMVSAARAAAAIAEGNAGREASEPVRVSPDQAPAARPAHVSEHGTPVRGCKGRPNPAADRYPMATDWRTVDSATLIPQLERLERRIRERDSRVIKVIAMLSSQVSDILMFNSLGELRYDTRPLGSISVQTVFQQGDKIENTSAGRSFRMGAEMIGDSLIEEIATLATEGIDERFAATRPKGGKMPVVMAAGASGILLHEAMGHAFEADFNRKGQSVFSGRIGERVCDSKITIVDDGTIRANRGAVNYDDEGVPGQYTAMVEDGILTSYLHDRISARWFGVRPTGNGRRESFRYNPIPRMRATYMLGGECSPSDIISSVKKGIYVDKFSNGEVKIGEGDFTFYVKSGMLIENGRLTAPVKDINIIGNGPQALADISMVGNDPLVDDGTWTCGKGQSVPVSCGIPTVLVNGLTVGGNQA